MRKLSLILLIPAVLLATRTLCAPAAHAAEKEAPGYAQCMSKAMTTVAMVDCTQKATDYWDRKLNENYKQAMRAAKNDLSRNPDGPQNLLQAERAWMTYRDAMAKHLSNQSGGTIDRLNTSGFVMEVTKQQARMLATEPE